MSNRRGERFGILDPPALNRMLVQAIDADFGGSIRAAAFQAARVPKPPMAISEDQERRLDRTRKAISRILGEKVKAITRGTLESLVRVVGEERREDLERTLGSPAAKEALNDYSFWLLSELDPDFLPKYLQGMGEPEEALEEALEEVFDVLRSAVIRWLRAECPERMGAFDEFLIEMGHYQRRADLSFKRLAQPMVDHLRSGGIERSLEEMTEEELDSYVRLTLEREKLLLRRPPDKERSEKVGDLVARARYLLWASTKRSDAGMGIIMAEIADEMGINLGNSPLALGFADS